MWNNLSLNTDCESIFEYNSRRKEVLATFRMVCVNDGHIITYSAGLDLPVVKVEVVLMADLLYPFKVEESSNNGLFVSGTCRARSGGDNVTIRVTYIELAFARPLRGRFTSSERATPLLLP